MNVEEWAVQIIKGATRLEALLVELKLYDDALFYRSIRGDYGQRNVTEPQLKKLVFRLDCSKYSKSVLLAAKSIKVPYMQTGTLVELTCDVTKLIEDHLTNDEEVDEDWQLLRDHVDELFIAGVEEKEKIEEAMEIDRQNRKTLTIWSLLDSGVVSMPEGSCIYAKQDWVNRWTAVDIDYFKFPDGAEFPMDQGDDFLSHYKSKGYEVISSRK